MKRVGLQTLGLGMIATSLWLAVPSVVSAAAAVDTSTATTNKPVVVQVAGQVVKQPPEIWLTFGLDRVPLLHYKLIGGIPAWQCLASFVYIILAFYVSKFLDYFIRSRVQAWAARTANRFDDMVVELVRGPVKV